jgi:hypothetical protein
VLLAGTFHRYLLPTQFIWGIDRPTLGSSGAEGFHAKNFLLRSLKLLDELLLTASIHLVLNPIAQKPLCLDSTTHRIDCLLLSIKRRFILRLRLRRFTSGLHPAQLADGPSVHPTVTDELDLHAMYQILWRLHQRLFLCAVGSCYNALFFLFLSQFRLSKYILLSHFDMWNFASLGPRNVYKDMLNNIVSLIGYVAWITKIKLEHMMPCSL